MYNLEQRYPFVTPGGLLFWERVWLQYLIVKLNLYTKSNDYCALYRQSSHHREESQYNDWIIRVSFQYTIQILGFQRPFRNVMNKQTDNNSALT